MKSVIIVRHSKSDWSNVLSDLERPVRADRRSDALLIAKEIAKKDAIPQHIISSPAVRTYQTAETLAAHWDYLAEDITSDSSLYECAAKDILSVIKNAHPDHHTIAIVCHNPAITDFVNTYSDTYLANVPTTGAIHISFDTDDWKEVRGKGKTMWILRPKELRVEDPKLN